MMKTMSEPRPLHVSVCLEDDVYWATGALIGRGRASRPSARAESHERRRYPSAQVERRLRACLTTYSGHASSLIPGCELRLMDSLRSPQAVARDAAQKR